MPHADYNYARNVHDEAISAYCDGHHLEYISVMLKYNSDDNGLVERRNPSRTALS